MTHRLDEIAASLGLDWAGDGALTVAGARAPAEAGASHLALAMAPEHLADVPAGGARAAIVPAGTDWTALGLAGAIFAPHPRLALAGVTAFFDPGPQIAPGVHPSAVIAPDAEIGAGAAIGPFVVIGAGARVGPGARIASHVSIGAGSVIGPDCLLLEGVRIGPRVTIGARFIAHPNAVVGADGFSYATEGRSAVEDVRASLGAEVGHRQSRYTRVHSLGSVVIGDDVEIGALSSIDRGTIADTTIGRGTKIDNQVHVGHNGRIGADVLLCGQVGLAGSVTIGDRSVLGGKVGVSDHVTIGADVVAGGASAIFTNVPAGRAVLGHPAIKMDQNIALMKLLRRLPRLFAQVAELQNRVSKSGRSD